MFCGTLSRGLSWNVPANRRTDACDHSLGTYPYSESLNANLRAYMMMRGNCQVAGREAQNFVSQCHTSSEPTKLRASYKGWMSTRIHREITMFLPWVFFVVELMQIRDVVSQEVASCVLATFHWVIKPYCVVQITLRLIDHHRPSIRRIRVPAKSLHRCWECAKDIVSCHITQGSRISSFLFAI